MLLVLNAAGLFGAEAREPAQSAFEKAYGQWLAERKNAENQFDFNAAGPMRYAGFKEIIRLGPAALPEIIEKLPSDPLLMEAFYVISKKHLPEFKTLQGADRVAYLKTWWSTVEESTSAKFTEESGRLKQAKRDSRADQQSTARESIRRMGVVALPHLFTEIAKGETDLIPVASQLVGGELPPTATPAQCADWWQQNKTKWSIPPHTGQTKTKENP